VLCLPSFPLPLGRARLIGKLLDPAYVCIGEATPVVPIARHFIDLLREKPSLQRDRRNADSLRSFREVLVVRFAHTRIEPYPSVSRFNSKSGSESEGRILARGMEFVWLESSSI